MKFYLDHFFELLVWLVVMLSIWVQLRRTPAEYVSKRRLLTGALLTTIILGSLTALLLALRAGR